jgi:peptidoglycan/xylan/chitin deacetylase (PgdA/CDA1 family)
MRIRIAVALSVAWFAGSAAGAMAADCPGNPNALGTSRTITIKPSDFPLVGREQYQETLPLKNREVVLTFDDGPMPPYSGRILDTLAADCVKATFFALGANVAEAPDLLRRMVKEGHTVGTHTFDHDPLSKMPIEDAMKEIDKGIAVAVEALGNPRDLAPFFRAPYLDISRAIEKNLYSRGIMVWSIDVASEDWTELTEDQMVELVMARLEKVGKGIVLLHDIQPLTARALPKLIAELKRRKFSVVHVVPAPSAPARSTSIAR